MRLLAPFLALLIAERPAEPSEFHLFAVIWCTSYCHVTFRDHQVEYYSITEHQAHVTRHLETPVEMVTMRVDNFFNTTDFMPETTELEWVSHRNKTFFYEGAGFMIIGHYFCPEERCLTDNVRFEYKKKVGLWCNGLVLLGLVLFLLLSGIGEMIFVSAKTNIFGGKTPQNDVFNTLELVDMSRGSGVPDHNNDSIVA